ncbi:MAG: glycosyltransferase family 2 protein [Alicyclobacillus sp.]|nr:glycosyltransferase family 2 protein [Alicyclobacillus sp.]
MQANRIAFTPAIDKPHHAPRPDFPFVSVVIPAYNEEDVIETTLHRLMEVMDSLELPYELICVNDGSRDGTLDRLVRLAQTHNVVKVIDLSRNFGHQIAVTAGIERARGDVVVLIDADLQDPPELIPSFLEKWREGYDVVYAVRQRRDGESWFKRWTASAFYRILRRLTDVDIPLDTGDFRLMNRNVVDSLLSIRERHRFVRGLVSWVGFTQIGIPYVRSERFAGESKYPLSKMIRLSIEGITSFSFKPLQASTILGFIGSFVGFIGILSILYLRLFTRSTVQGWTSLMVVVLFIGGTQLFMLGVLGEYIGRIYDEVRGRPLYLVRAEYNFDTDRA